MDCTRFGVVFACIVALSLSANVAQDCTVTQFSADCGKTGPSNDEAWLLETVNVARSNPPAYGNYLVGLKSRANIAYAIKQYGIDVNQVISDFNQISAVPPFLYNDGLTTSANVHNRDMDTYGYQGHVDHDGTSWDTRIGKYYSGSAIAENVYAKCPDMIYANAGFFIDFGVSSLGHRKNLFGTSGYGDAIEVGFGVVKTGNGYYLTEEFGSRGDMTSISGSIYVDTDGDNALTSGEGVQATIVFINTAGTSYKVKSFTSGYYRADLPAGTWTMQVRDSGFSVSRSGIVLGEGMRLRRNCKRSTSDSAPATNDGTTSWVARDRSNDDGSVDIYVFGQTPTPVTPPPPSPPTPSPPTPSPPVTPTPPTPSPPTPSPPVPVPSSNSSGDIIEFRWTSRGAKVGSCIQITEPKDPHTWKDNYLCAVNEDISGWHWTNSGFNDTAWEDNFNWIQFDEKSDLDGWDDNFLGIPANDTRKYAFSSAGKIPSMTCIRTREGADPDSWRDNWWCTSVNGNGVINVGANGVYNNTGPHDEDSKAIMASSASILAINMILFALFALLF